MNQVIIGKEVFHKLFGTGSIVEKVKGTIFVQFGSDVKKFSYPEVFEQFLTTQDIDLQLQVQRDMEEKRREKENHRAIVSNGASLTSKPMKAKYKDNKVKSKNIAFKCNYCNGGASKESIGFNGVCSDVVIRYNIEEQHRVWCSDQKCFCRQYLNGEISRQDLIDNMENGNFLCYESAMLKTWKASAGVIRNGINREKRKKILNVQQNSLAVLTTREPYNLEDKRFIFAVFLVGDVFEGDDIEEGYVSANSTWKIKLTPEEAHKMLFWNYYVNENAPEKIVFASHLHRYISDDQAVQILKDIVAVKERSNEKEFAQKFLYHYCTVNQIDADRVPLPKGALVQKKWG